MICFQVYTADQSKLRIRIPTKKEEAIGLINSAITLSKFYARKYTEEGKKNKAAECYTEIPKLEEELKAIKAFYK